jgi:hypothetical protein
MEENAEIASKPRWRIAVATTVENPHETQPDEPADAIHRRNCAAMSARIA